MGGKIKLSTYWWDMLEKENPSYRKIVSVLIPKPLDVDVLIRKVEKGKLVTQSRIRKKLEKDQGADSACAKATGIFLRIVVETAEEDLREGRKAADEITPYWRVIKKDGRLTRNTLGE